MPASFRRATYCLLILMVLPIVHADDAMFDPDGAWGEPTAPRNSAPSLSGSPPGTAIVGQNYVFRPTALDADGDALTFSGTNLPPWLTLNPSNGTLSGVPAASHVGDYGSIYIIASDWQATAWLGPFDISVADSTKGDDSGGGDTTGQPAPTGSVTLNWQPPTQREDGTPLVNLAGYRVYAGRTAQSMTLREDLDNPGLTRHVVDNLSIGTWWFTMTAYDAAGLESDRAGTVVRYVN